MTSLDELKEKILAKGKRATEIKRPPPVSTKFHDNKNLAHLEMEALKAGMMYTEIESKKGAVFKGKSSLTHLI